MVNSLLAEACWGTWDEAAHGHAVGQTTDGPKLPAAASWTPGLRAPQAPTPLITPLALASHFAAIHKTETYSPEQLREDLSADPFAWHVHCRALAHYDTLVDGAARKVRATIR